MKKLLTTLFASISFISYGQGHFPVGGANDTIDISNIKVKDKAYYDNIPSSLTDTTIPAWGNIVDGFGNYWDTTSYAIDPYEFLARETQKRPASYQYLYMNGAVELNVVYAYGTKGIVYNFFRDSAYGMRYCRRVFSVDMDTTTGLEIPLTRKENTINWLGMAVRYKLPSTTDRKWFPYHAGSLSTKVVSTDSTFIINGQKYNIGQIPTSPLLFTTFSINQTVYSSYNNDGVYEMEWILSYIFDSRQLTLNNRFRILKDIDVERWLGARLSLDSCSQVVCNNGNIYTNAYDNLSFSYRDRPTSLMMMNNNVSSYSDVSDVFFNISADKDFFNPYNTITVFNRTSRSQNLYYNLTPFLDLQYTRVDSGETFISGNRLAHIPNSYSYSYNAPSLISNASYYTKSQINSFFSGDASISGYNKSTWDLAHIQGGNSFGDTSRLGTNDNYPLTFETNGTTKGGVTTSGVLYLGANLPAQTSSEHYQYLPPNGYIQGGFSATGAGAIQFTQVSGATAGFGTWITDNAYYDVTGATWRQPRATAVNSYLFGVTHHNQFQWRYAASGGVANGAISPTTIMTLTNAGNLSNAGTLTIGSIAALGSTATTYLTNTSGLVQSRTVAQVRADVGADNATNITSGTLAVARGGTGTTTTPSIGTVLIGNGTTYTNSNPMPINTLTVTGTTSVPATAMQATYKLDCSGGNRTFTFTPAYTGQIIVVKRIDGTGNTCTVQASSGNIDGSPNRTLITQYESLQLQWDGTNLNALN